MGVLFNVVGSIMLICFATGFIVEEEKHWREQHRYEYPTKKSQKKAS